MAKKKAAETQEIIDALTKRKKPETVKIKDSLSTGSTLLNLACSGKQRGGLSRGHYYHFVGGSESGKSFLACTCFAEASINPNFDDYQFIYDSPEDGMLADVHHFFGKKAATRIKPPRTTKSGLPQPSVTIEEFFYNLSDALDRGPCIWVEDSLDALGTGAETDQFETNKKAHEDGKDAKGSYGTARAKVNSGYFREVLQRVRETGSILIIISQTRDNIGFGATFNPKVFGGGHALTFYATLQLWSSVKREEKVDYAGKPRSQGIIATVKVKKNRQTGRKSSVDIPIYWSSGIDDVGGNIDYLIEEGHWCNKSDGDEDNKKVKAKVNGEKPKRTPSVINAVEFKKTLKKHQLVKYIEDNDLEVELAAIVAKVWHTIEDAVAVQRKSRYET